MPGIHIHENSTAKSAFRQYSQDGHITWKEGDMLAGKMAMDPKKIWATFDIDGRNSIQSNELSKLKEAIDEPPGGSVADFAFRKYSQDGHITRGEGKILAVIMDMDPKEFWATFDTDGRGSIQGNELKKLEKAIMEISWPTDIESRTPDGKFGPAQQIWSECWLLACLAAVANDEDGQKILAQSIKKAIGGYQVTFPGLPNNKPVFISDAELRQCLDTNGGDADTRIMDLAADKFFAIEGNFKSLFLACFSKVGFSPDEAQAALQDFCRANNIKDPMTFNPIRNGGLVIFGYFLLAGMIPESLMGSRESQRLRKSDLLKFLDKYVTNDPDGPSVVIAGKENPLGPGPNAKTLAILWDVVRAGITSNGTVDPQQRVFLTALDKWLGTGSNDDLAVLRSAAANLKYKHVEKFVSLLPRTRNDMSQSHIDLLRSGVKELLSGGTGYIGFTGGHAGIIQAINKAADTFAYIEPNNPKVRHTGDLADLIEAVLSGKVMLAAVEPERNDVLALFDPKI